MPPEVHYARSGDVTIAYQVVGDGPIDMVTASGSVTHLEVLWEEPGYSRYLQRLARFARLIVFDKRGVGMSDRVAGVATLEERMDDLRAVMDAVGSPRAVMFGQSEGGPMAVLFAATFPERTTALVVYGSMVRGGWHPDDPNSLAIAPTRADYERLVAEREESVRREWGAPLSLSVLAPSRADDPAFAAWWSRLLRLGSSPAAVIALSRMNREIDVRGVLPTIRVPTLVLHRRDDTDVPVGEGRYLASHIPGARYVELPGRDHLPSVGDMEGLVGEIEEFVTGVRSAPEVDRILATVVFTDMVGSTELARRLADRAWADLLARYLSRCQLTIDAHRGRLVDTAGDGVFATFDGPARAVRCALALVRTAQDLGVEVRAGVHTGECELDDGSVRGIAVHVGARVAAAASPSEVLVSGTVRDLVAGSGLTFEPRGQHSLKGVDGLWTLFRATG